LNEFGSAGALLEGRAPARPKNFRRLCRSTALQRPQFFGLPICRFHDLPIRFGSAGASPSHHALRSHPFRSSHGIIATNMKMVRGAKCDVRCWVRCAECGVQLMGFVHQIYGLKNERELALCVSNEWVSAYSVRMQIDSAKQVSTKK
jgi:hypothetical protein